MKVKEYLQQLPVLDMKINLKLKELEALKVKLIGVGGVDYSNDRVQTSPQNAANFTEILHNIECLENEINTDIDKLVNKRHRIINQINELQNVQYIEILYKRYVEYKDLKEIGKEMEYSYQHIRRLHISSLKEFQKLLHNAT